MPIVRQTSFAGGELSPTLYARSELDRYRIGARTLKNFLVTPFGALANRPGTRYVAHQAISNLVAVRLSSNGLVRSVDGLSWTADTLPSTASRYCAGSNGYRIITSGGTTAVWEVSDDNGDTWTTKVKPDTYSMYGVFWDGANFHACGESGRIERSTDNAETWTTQTMSPAVVLSAITGGWFGDVYVIIAVGASGESFYTTNKGVSWVKKTLPRSITYNDIAYSDGVAIAVGNAYIARTTDGVTWVEQAISGNHTAVICARGVWWIFDTSSTTAHKSIDGGLTWSNVTLAGTYAPKHPVYTGSNIVVPAGGGFLVGPADGSAWSYVTVAGDWRGVTSLFEAAETTHPRLIPFVFSDEQALVVEFRAGYIRFIENGAYVMSGGSAYAIASPYSESDLPRLKYAQMGNIITLTHPSYTPRELIRTAVAPLTFTLTTIGFDAPICPLDTSLDEQNRQFVRVYPTTPASAPPGPQWRWTITAICRSLDGSRTWETKPAKGPFGRLDEDDPVWDVGTLYGLGATVKRTHADNVTRSYQCIAITSTGDDPLTSPLVWSPQAPLDFITGIDLTLEAAYWTWPYRTQADFIIIGFNVYRGTNDWFGLVAVKTSSEENASPINNKLVAGSTCDFSDNGIAPDYLIRPPLGQNPFVVFDEDHAIVRTEEPSCVVYQDERLVFGGTAERPNYLFMSRVGDWHNFDQYPIVKDDDSITVGLAGRRFEEIRSLLPGRSLLAFSTMSEWCLDGGQPDQPMTPAAISARIRSERGSTWLDALKVGDDHALFVQRKGMIVRDLAFDGQAGTYVNGNLSLFSQHLFAGKKVVDWCWVEDPWSVVWAVLDDGTLLSLTFMPEQQVIAWARHELGGGGIAESICSAPEGEEDIVYLIVRRGSVRSIERMATRTVSDFKEGIFLDGAVSYTFATATTAITGLTHLEGLVVYALADGIVRGPFTVTSGAITLPVAAVRVHVGLKYNCDFESLDCPPGEGKTRVKAIRQAWVELEASAGSIQAGQDLSHLETWSGNEADETAKISGLMTGQARIPTISHWNHGGRVCVRQSDPLPCTILAVTREVEYGQ